MNSNDGVFIEEAYKPLKITSIKKTGRVEKVYNLEVEKNNSYVVGTNNIIVHNCDMGATQKGFNDLFSAIDNAIEKTNAIFVFSNKVYSNFGDEYNPFKQAGGESVIYNPSLSIKLTALSDSDDITDAQSKEEKLRKKSALGSSLQVVRGTISKSRFGTLSRNATFIINQTYGVVKNSGLLEMLLDFGVAQKTGTRYVIPGVIDDPFFKKDFLEIFGKKEAEYIDKLQVKLDDAEDRIKKQQQNLDVNDIQEARAAEGEEVDDEDITLSQMQKEMEIDEEGSSQGI